MKILHIDEEELYDLDLSLDYLPFSLANTVIDNKYSHFELSGFLYEVKIYSISLVLVGVKRDKENKPITYEIVGFFDAYEWKD